VHDQVADLGERESITMRARRQWESLTGLTVVELAAWVARPSAGALLADWGADVWKVESPKGDPFRAIITSQGYSAEIPNAPFTSTTAHTQCRSRLQTDDGRTAMKPAGERRRVPDEHARSSHWRG